MASIVHGWGRDFAARVGKGDHDLADGAAGATFVDPTDARNEALRCFGRSHRRAQGSGPRSSEPMSIVFLQRP
jgi:hypothetical protein